MISWSISMKVIWLSWDSNLLPLNLQSDANTCTMELGQYDLVHDKAYKMPCAPSKDSDQPRLIWVWADLSLRHPHEESLGPWLPIECTAKTLIRLGRCPGWSESSLGPYAILLVLSCTGSYIRVSENEVERRTNEWRDRKMDRKPDALNFDKQAWQKSAQKDYTINHCKWPVQCMFTLTDAACDILHDITYFHDICHNDVSNERQNGITNRI